MYKCQLSILSGNYLPRMFIKMDYFSQEIHSSRQKLVLLYKMEWKQKQSKYSRINTAIRDWMGRGSLIWRKNVGCFVRQRNRTANVLSNCNMRRGLSMDVLDFKNFIQNCFETRLSPQNYRGDPCICQHHNFMGFENIRAGGLLKTRKAVYYLGSHNMS